MNITNDYVLYGDTDSCIVCIDDFCKYHMGEDIWNSKTDNEKIEVIDDVSEYIKNYINSRIFKEVQLDVYNSSEKDYRIIFEKEKIAKSGLFVAKKMYSMRSLWIDGEYVDKISTTGLTIVRGDSSEAIRVRLRDIMYMILRDEREEDIVEKVNKYKRELNYVSPEEIAANIGVSNVRKWRSKDGYRKGAPWHVKGVINYERLLRFLKIDDKYENLEEDTKVKVVYVKPNKWNMETVSFYRWPEEFNEAVQIDWSTMIDKFFLKKLKILLEPINRCHILNSEGSLDLFFQY